MPEQFTQTVTARRLLKGDKITGVEGTHEVASVSVKQKYVHVKMVGSDKIGYFEMDQPFEVTRTRPTKEERAAADKKAALRDLDRRERQDRERLDKARKDMIKSVTRGDLMSWHIVEALAEAERIVVIWNRLRSIHSNAIMLIKEDAPDWNTLSTEQWEGFAALTRIEAAIRLRKRLAQDVMRNIRMTHHSTSVAANLFEAYDMEASVKWLRERDYDIGVIDGVLYE